MLREQSGIDFYRRNSTMASLNQILHEDRHPVWLVDALILSAVAYSRDPEQDLKTLDGVVGLPATAKYRFLGEQELRAEGFESRKQALLVVKSISHGHMIIACRGTTGIADAFTDLNMMQRSMTLGAGSAHAGFLHRAKTIPLEYPRRQLIRGEHVVLTGHSLGGAVASLLALRLLEVTPRWCHEQIQCYTFGCPFFANTTLARLINSRYKKHFVHIVSKNDIVPKVMPLAHILYTLWSGLAAGPLEDVVNVARLGILVARVLPLPRLPKRQLGTATIVTQTASWLPWLLRGMVHRLLALALCYHSGQGYAFAGKMVLLNCDRDYDGEVDAVVATNDVEGYLTLKLTADSMKEHSLLSYIENVFSVQSKQSVADSGLVSGVLQRATVNITESEGASSGTDLVGQGVETTTSTASSAAEKIPVLRKSKSPKNFKRVVACLMFARRMQETNPAIVKEKKRKKRMLSFLYENWGKLGRFARRWNGFFLASSIYYVVVHFRKSIKWK